jgi:hypothetical protein
MQGGRNTTSKGDGPISKPRFPLPLDFARRGNERELSIEEVQLKDQRAYFYRKDTTDSGSPIYDFVITAETNDEDSH